MIVVGIGAAPRTDLAARAGLRLHHGGVEVDERLRSSDPHIYAIGDIASAWNPRYGRSLRLEHWDNARRQGRTAAAIVAGKDVIYDRVPYLYSDQYDLGMEHRGLANEFDEVVIRGDLDQRKFHAFWLQRGRITAAMNVNLWDDGDQLQALVEGSGAVDVRALADPAVPLTELLGEAVAA
jgi:NADPH-dependent 2,4-dienoyl-CoA reductase/sulfur reductase-like enzyme